MSGSLEFSFEEMPIIAEGGIHAGLMNGTAEVSYFPDGEFHVGKIYIDGYRKRADGKGFDSVPVELEYEVTGAARTLQYQLYLAIWSELTDGSFKSHVEAAVSKALDDDGVPHIDMNDEHRLSSQQMGAR